MPNVQETGAEEVLVVDDDPLLCDLIGQALRSEGYSSIICMDAEQALALPEHKSFDLAFVDISLPDMSGLDLAAKLKQDRPRLEVVFVTASGNIDDVVQAIKIGAYDYLRKPFSISEFNLCLKRFQERKELRKRTRLAEQRYCDLVQNIPLLIYMLRRNLEVDFVNHAALPMLGFTPKEAREDPAWFTQRIHSEDRSHVVKLLEAAFKPNGPSFSVECRLIHKKGQPIHVIIKSMPFPEDEERTQRERLDGIIVDITDRVFLEKALVQADRLKILGAISAEVAHEIRNPLVSIGGFALRLKKKAPDLPEAGIIFTESQKLEQVLNRIERYLKTTEIQQEECPVNEVVKERIELLCHEMEQKGIICRSDLDSRQPRVYADRNILGLVCSGLIRNAIDAMETGQVLTVRTFESGQFIHIDLRGKTAKLRRKRQELHFLPFEGNTVTSSLPLIYRSIRDMGGIISYLQEEEFGVFTISLPKMIPIEEAGQKVSHFDR